MDIIVKSFNRPYYLERCLTSLRLQLTGDYRVKVLDDGTPDVYLQKIAALFPEAQIIKSPFHDEKAKAIEAAATTGEPFTLFSVPSRFWVSEVQKCSSIFYMFEDDFWLTQPVDLTEVTSLMQANQLALLKTYWGNNTRFMKGKKQALSARVEAYVPKIPAHVDFIFENRLKSQTFLHRTKLFWVSTRFTITFYDLYSVAAAFFDKAYWLYLWEDAPDGKVNETLQLRRAKQFWKRFRPRFARFTQDVSETSYITSATNSYPNVPLDIFRFNHHLNQAWLKGELNAMENYPLDFPETTIQTILDKADDPQATAGAWRHWITIFKGLYTRFGYQIR